MTLSNRNFKFARYLLPFVFLLSAYCPTISASMASQVFERLKKGVFKIKTALDQEGHKASYGSGFAVSSDGLVITNYHVVSQALERHSEYKIFVILNERPVEAKIISINVVQDLALLKIEEQPPTVLRLRRPPPKIGDKILSIGFPKELKMSIVEGTYNGIKKHGPYENIHMSSPINSGMSGGPTVNAQGEVIGVNVSVLLSSQNISFAVPVSFAYQLLDDYHDKKIKEEEIKDLQTLSRKEIDQIIQEQLLVVQSVFAENVFDLEKENIKLLNWEITGPGSSVKCWAVNRSDKKKNRYKAHREICYVPEAAFIGDGKYSGSYEVSYTAVESEKLLLTQFYGLLDSVANGQGHDLKSLFLKFEEREGYTKYDCQESVVINQSKIPFKLRYCLTGHLDMPDLYDVTVKAISLLKEKNAMVFFATLKGFTLENVTDFVKKQIENMRLSNDANHKS